MRLNAVFLLVLLILWPTAGTADDADNESNRFRRFFSCRFPFEPVEDQPAASADAPTAESPVDDAANAESTTEPTTDEKTPAQHEAMQAVLLIDCGNFTLVGKNLQQKDEAGDSRFGVGLDWKYAFGKTWGLGPQPQEDASKPLSGLGASVAANGEGFVSLGDANNDRETTAKTANANAILNQVRTTGNWFYVPPEPRASKPPSKGDYSSDAEFKRAMDEWKRDVATPHVIKTGFHQATKYSAFDFGAHGRTESNQNFDDTQYALGVSATAASGWLASYALYPLRFLVPQQDKYGNVVQSPLVFIGFDEVVGASHRSKIDGTNDEEFERFRLEAAWTTELLMDGLYPFVHFHLFHEIGAPGAIEAADKETATFLEAGADLYVGEAFQALRQFAGGTGGPFVTLKYTTGRLPPYLESDTQISAGLGFTF